MIVGFLINAIYPIIGISQPLSTVPVLLTMTGLTLTLFAISLKRNIQQTLDLFKLPEINLTSNFFKALLLTSLPLLGIIGAIYRNFTVPLLIIIVAALFVLTVISKSIIPSRLYPFLIFMICLGLALQFTLMSQHTMGNDAPLEYRTFLLTKNDGLWQPLSNVGQVEIYYNSMLSITILPTIYSTLVNINTELLFKILYPFIFCFVPVTLYKILSKQGWKPNSALIAALFLISSPLVFYGAEPLSVNRQIIGELFLVLSIYLLLETDVDFKKKTPLLIAFGAMTVVSHYSLMFLYLGFLIFVFLFLKIGRKSDKLPSITFILLMFSITFIWYSFFSSPLLPEAASTINNIISNFGSDLSNPAARSVELFTTKANFTIASPINWGLFGLVHIFVLIGLLLVTFKPKNIELIFKYRVMIIFSGILFFAIVVVPNFAPTLNFSRFYAIAFLFLAPCFVLGGKVFLNWFLSAVSKITHKQNWNSKANMAILLIAILASAYYLSQSGFINHVVGGSIQSYTLDWDKTLNINMNSSSEPAAKSNFYTAYTPNQDVYSATWLSRNLANTSIVYADSISIYHPLHVFGLISTLNTLT